MHLKSSTGREAVVSAVQFYGQPKNTGLVAIDGDGDGDGMAHITLLT